MHGSQMEAGERIGPVMEHEVATTADEHWIGNREPVDDLLVL